MKKNMWVIHNGKKLRWLKGISSKDSTYLIPAPDNNKDGTHMSLHKSGMMNIRNADKSLDIYNFKELFIQCIMQIWHKSLVPASEAKVAYVIKPFPDYIQKEVMNETETDVIINFDITLKYLLDYIKIYDLNDETPSEFMKNFSDSGVIFTDEKRKKILLFLKERPNVMFDGTKFKKDLDKSEIGRYSDKKPKFTIHVSE